ncbi:MAG TPA: alkaline phosphatase PhoX [Thermoanaerobaculia bacterium]|nr:alkaline phosphatase PhoX [Thermoanaerobaculia bacterium]
MIRTTAAAFAGLAARRSDAAAVPSPYGMLRPKTADNADEVLLLLPPDFRYTIVARARGVLDDGNPAPDRPDGMAAFQVGSELRLVRNHEVKDPVLLPLSPGPWSYDPRAGGGTTTLVVDPVTRLPLRQFVSLSGTSSNCAGGPTPWGSWISCEETVDTFTKPHGYCFEVPASADSAVNAVPLPHLGRFFHEAAAVDPATSIVYLTEDQELAGLYRCVLNEPYQLASGGRLQMLAVRDAPTFDASRGQTTGAKLPVTWVDIANSEAAVFQQGRARGGARFRRLEGAWFGNGTLFFTSTTGGERGIGQVWQYRPAAVRKRRVVGGASWAGELTLLFESPSSESSRMPDNLSLTPRGSLILCEDGDGGLTFLRGLTPRGDIFPFAQNISPGFAGSEFAGAVFSPDGQTLFVNLQIAGVTVAIWGPWGRGPL